MKFFYYRTVLLRNACLLFIGLNTTLLVEAQSNNWRTFDWQVGFGHTYLYDDYLSTLSHEGPSIYLSMGGTKSLHWGKARSTDNSNDLEKWSRRWSLSLCPAYTSSNAGSVFLYGNLDFRETIQKRVYQNPNWSFSLGGYASLNGGGRYCSQNGNNPGSADLMTDIGAAATANYILRTPKKNILFRYQGSLALAGLAFSPEYAESYYEIFYLKNYDNIIKFTSLQNMQSWTQQISADIPLNGRKSSFRIIYNNEGRVSMLNNIRIRALSSHISVGYIRYFTTL
jgi:hypothetical protein